MANYDRCQCVDNLVNSRNYRDFMKQFLAGKSMMQHWSIVRFELVVSKTAETVCWTTSTSTEMSSLPVNALQCQRVIHWLTITADNSDIEHAVCISDIQLRYKTLCIRKFILISTCRICRDRISYSVTATVTNIFISCKKSLILSRGKLQEMLTPWQFSNFTRLTKTLGNNFWQENLQCNFEHSQIGICGIKTAETVCWTNYQHVIFECKCTAMPVSNPLINYYYRQLWYCTGTLQYATC